MSRTKHVRALTAWEKKVRAVVAVIPLGSTLSYARVALLAGRPGSARAVARAMRSLNDVPWWRVIRSYGTLASMVAAEQRRHLAREGIKLKK